MVQVKLQNLKNKEWDRIGSKKCDNNIVWNCKGQLDNQIQKL